MLILVRKTHWYVEVLTSNFFSHENLGSVNIYMEKKFKRTKIDSDNREKKRIFGNKYSIPGNVTRREGNITDLIGGENPNQICNSNNKSLMFALETELRFL